MQSIKRVGNTYIKQYVNLIRYIRYVNIFSNYYSNYYMAYDAIQR